MFLLLAFVTDQIYLQRIKNSCDYQKVLRILPGLSSTQQKVATQSKKVSILTIKLWKLALI
jgi:hypothetical protein